MSSNPHRFTEIVDRVLQKIREKRVALLWPQNIGCELNPIEGVRWIHYISGTLAPPLTVAYRLSDLPNPRKEVVGLSMLVIPSASPLLLGELKSGFPSSKEAQFVSECMNRFVPTLMDCSQMRAFFDSSSQEYAKLEEAMAWFSAQGGTVLGGPCASKNTSEAIDTTLCLDKPAWYSWGEIRSRVSPKGRIVIASGVRFTAEALDRLQSLCITIEQRG